MLAGGLSTRFGEPKQLYKIAGKEMIEWVLTSAERTGAEILVAIKRGAEYLLPYVNRHRARAVYDELDAYSPLVGLCSAAKACTSDIVAVVPSDSPFVSPKFFERITGALAGLSVSAVIPLHDDGRIEAIHAVYRRDELLKACEAALRSPDLSVKSLPMYLPSVYFMPVSEMDEEEKISLIDFDEKGELMGFRAR